MDKKEIILHIGAPKTATTLIQRCLQISSDLLASNGIYVCDFLGATNHKLLAYTFLENNQKNDAIQKRLNLDTDFLRSKSKAIISDKLHQLISLDSSKKLIISSEDFQSKLNRSKIENLTTFFDEMNVSVSIVLYLREQASALNSHFSTALKSSVSGFRLHPTLPSKSNFLNLDITI